MYCVALLYMRVPLYSCRRVESHVKSKTWECRLRWQQPCLNMDYEGWILYMDKEKKAWLRKWSKSPCVVLAREVKLFDL